MRPSEVVGAHRDDIRAIGAKHRAGEIRVFGSVARGTDTPESDLDLLVSFDDGASYFDLVGLTQELTLVLDVPVDVVSDFGSSPVLDRARADARPL
jgi:uncharacterized protein